MKNLESRLAALEQARRAPKTGGYIIYFTPGEPGAEIARRVEAAGRPVLAVPTPCGTVEEWVELARGWRG